MWDLSGRYVVVYNGEIYNWRELRRSLDEQFGGIEWSSSSDTEVIIEGFARNGPEFLDRLNGIFAVAIYDTVSRDLVVLRDPLGIKPLFWCEKGSATFFASEIAALRTIDGVVLTPREEAYAEQLAFMYVPEPFTTYREVLKVPPGVLWTLRDGVRRSERRLFEWLDRREVRGTEPELVEQFKILFDDAVRRQIEADVPVSLMLSGGLDSSAIASSAVKAGAKIDSAYTIAVTARDARLDGQDSDLRAARVVADAFGLRLHVVTAEQSMLDLLPALAGHLEEGLCDPAAVNAYVISRAASKAGVKVLLTGQGADELFAGYRRTFAESILSRVPSSARRVASVLARALPSRAAGPFNATLRRLRRFSSLARQEGPERIRSMYTWAPPELIAQLFVRAPAQKWIGVFEERADRLGRANDVIRLMTALDELYDLRSLNLAYCDRMSMAVGVEARVPFLDFELLSFARALPSDMLLRGRTGKYILRKAMQGVLPESILHRSKAGFGLPVRSWLAHENALVHRLCDSSRIRRQGIFRADAVNTLIDEQRRGTEDWANLIYAFLSIQVSLENAES
jgi:asparagine synthase (glutamine-hydrolysing)